MSSIFETVGDVVEDTVDFVDENAEILAAIALAYATGGTSTAATAATAAELTAAEIAAAEAAAAAAATTTAATSTAATTAQLEAAKLAALNSGEVALAGSPGFLPNTMTVAQAYPELATQVSQGSAVFNPPTNIESIYPELRGLVDPASTVVMPGASQPNIFERGITAVKDAGTAFVNDPIGSTSRAFEEYRPKTPGEYFNTALTMSAAGSLYDAAQTPEQTTKPRSTTNTYTGQQAPKTYVTQPATQPLPVRYETAKQQVSKTVGTPTNVGLLAVNNSPFYDFLRTNNINRGIL
jgi:hypothetical protein